MNKYSTEEKTTGNRLVFQKWLQYDHGDRDGGSQSVTTGVNMSDPQELDQESNTWEVGFYD